MIPLEAPITSKPGWHNVFDLQAEFELLFRAKLERVADGAGTGREGLADGWIRGLSMYRPDHAELAGTIIGNEVGKLFHHRAIIQVMLNVMDPGAELLTHIDGAPYHQRWHYVLKSKGAEFYQPVTDWFTPRQGRWFGPVSYWVPHAVRNLTDTERIHLIVDFD